MTRATMLLGLLLVVPACDKEAEVEERVQAAVDREARAADRRAETVAREAEELANEAVAIDEETKALAARLARQKAQHSALEKQLREVSNDKEREALLVKLSELERAMASDTEPSGS